MIDQEDYHEAALQMLRNAIGADNVDASKAPVEVEDAAGGAWVLVSVFVTDAAALEEANKIEPW